MLQFRVFYFITAFILFLVEVYIAMFIHDGIIRPYIGDFLVVILMYCFMRSFFNLTILRTAMVVLLFAYLVEALQFFKIVEKLNLQDVKFARIIIGTSFAWADILAYSAGIICVVGIENILVHKKQLPLQS